MTSILQFYYLLIIYTCFLAKKILLWLYQAIRRYEKEFGSRNYRFTVGKVEFIAIDAQTIDGMHGNNVMQLFYLYLYPFAVLFQ